MKIVLICSNYEPGGAQKAMFKLRNEFVLRGFDSECLFFYNKSGYTFKEKPVILINNNKVSIKNLWIVLIRLFQYLKQEQPDAVITFLPYGNTIGCFTALLSGVNCRVASHRSEAKREMSFLIRVLDFLFAWLKIYTHITAVSNSTKKSFKHYSFKDFSRMVVVPNGVNFKPSKNTKKEARIALNLDTESFLIGSVGRLVETKNHQLLIEILPFLTEVKLVIVGKGKLKKDLESRAIKNDSSDRLIIIDELSTNQIPIFLNSIDVFLMPSFYEGLSNALIEALAAGIPIIASDVDSQKDVLYNEKDNYTAGILLPIDRPKIWAEKIREIMVDSSFRKDLCDKSKERAKEFSMDKMVNGFLTVINKKEII